MPALVLTRAGWARASDVDVDDDDDADAEVFVGQRPQLALWSGAK